MFLKKIIITISLITLTLNAALAQNAQGGDVEAFVQDSKKDFLIVIAGGLAGAVLGLSTLSFVEEPKEHTRNILVGASMGIILGVGYVALSQANRSRDMFYQPEEAKLESSKSFNTFARANWHDSEVSLKQSHFNTLNQVGFSFTY